MGSMGEDCHVTRATPLLLKSAIETSAYGEAYPEASQLLSHYVAVFFRPGNENGGLTRDACEQQRWEGEIVNQKVCCGGAEDPTSSISIGTVVGQECSFYRNGIAAKGECAVKVDHPNHLFSYL